MHAFNSEAAANYAFPLTLANMQVLQDPKKAGRPTVFADRTEITMYPYFQGLNDASFLDMKNRSWRLEAVVRASGPSSSGAIFANGNRFNGMALYFVDGRAIFQKQ